jgi:erythrin-vacuolar iron transport family protein
MTTAEGIGHTLPYLIPHFRTATAVAVVVVAIQVLLIS